MRTIDGWALVIRHEEGDPSWAQSLCITFREINGKIHLTSTVIKAEGRCVTTGSGSQYSLGNPDPIWLADFKARGGDFNPDEPLAGLVCDA